jgi:Family of unknown function (DUF6502)
VAFTVSEDKGQRRQAMTRNAAIKALSDLLEPLAGFVFDAGLSTYEVQSLFRVAAVKSMANRQREVSRRINISGIAASTGISRAEISRILKAKTADRIVVSDGQLQATNRILKMWHYDPNYTNANGQPADLRIFGSGPTFDSLVRRHGRGIPTRAMLDELSRTGSIEVLGSERVRAKTLLALDRGASTQAVRAFGDRASALMSGMLSNMRGSDQHQFISTIESEIKSKDLLPLIRREVSSKGTDFLAVMRDRLFADNSTGRDLRKSRDSTRVSVMVFYHEKSQNKLRKKQATIIRRNFRRTR